MAFSTAGSLQNKTKDLSDSTHIYHWDERNLHRFKDDVKTWAVETLNCDMDTNFFGTICIESIYNIE